MLIQRSIPIILEKSEDLLKTVEEFNRYQKSISEICFNFGKTRSALALHKEVYKSKPSSLCAQMKCSAIRLVASAYASAKSNHKSVERPFVFRKKRALFLIGKRGRDASFCKDGNMSVWTIAGRKKLKVRIPEAFQKDFCNAKIVDALSVGIDGKGTLCITLEVPDPKSIIPVGIDIGIRNILVASTKENTLRISGKPLLEKRKRTRKTRARIQSKKSSKKELGKDDRSVRRVLKSLSRKQKNFTKTFCNESAAKLCKWVPKGSVLILEDLKIKKVSKKEHIRKGTRRKVNSFCYSMLIQSVTNRSQRDGIGIECVNPAYTSQVCSACHLLGDRIGSKFFCPNCLHRDCADRNASLNVLSRFTVLRGGAHPSTCAEDRSPDTVKPSPSGEGS